MTQSRSDRSVGEALAYLPSQCLQAEDVAREKSTWPLFTPRTAATAIQSSEPSNDRVMMLALLHGDFLEPQSIRTPER